MSLRDNSLVSGMSVFSIDSETAQSLVSGGPAVVFTANGLANLTQLIGIRVVFTGTVVAPVVNVWAKLSYQEDFTRIYPYSSDGETLVDDTYVEFSLPIQLPRGSSLEIRVSNTSSSVGATAEVQELRVIEYKP